jgi:hypothetical protein
VHDLRGHPRSKVSEASSPAAAGNSNRQRAWHADTPQLGPVLSRSIPHTSQPPAAASHSPPPGGRARCEADIQY